MHPCKNRAYMSSMVMSTPKLYMYIYVMRMSIDYRVICSDKDTRAYHSEDRAKLIIKGSPDENTQGTDIKS